VWPLVAVLVTWAGRLHDGCFPCRRGRLVLRVAAAEGIPADSVFLCLLGGTAPVILDHLLQYVDVPGKAS